MVAQIKPVSYQRLAETDDHGLQSMTESPGQPQPPQQPQQAQPAQQPPPYLVGYAPAPAALQQASNNVSTIVTA